MDKIRAVFRGSTQDTRGSRFIQVAQTPPWLGGEQEPQLFQTVIEATLRDNIGPRASYFLTRNAADCSACGTRFLIAEMDENRLCCP